MSNLNPGNGTNVVSGRGGCRIHVEVKFGWCGFIEHGKCMKELSGRTALVGKEEA